MVSRFSNRSRSPELSAVDRVHDSAKEFLTGAIEDITPDTQITINNGVLCEIAGDAGLAGVVSCEMSVENNCLAFIMSSRPTDENEDRLRNLIILPYAGYSQRSTTNLIQKTVLYGISNLALNTPGIKPKTAEKILKKDEPGRFINENSVYWTSGIATMLGSIGLLETVASQSPPIMQGASAATIAVMTALQTKDAYINKKVNDGKILGYQPVIEFK